MVRKKRKSEVAQSCPTLGNPMDTSPPGSSVHGILQAKILEWVAISFSRGSSPPRDQTQSLTLQADSLPSESPGKPNRPINIAFQAVSWYRGDTREEAATAEDGRGGVGQRILGRGCCWSCRHPPLLPS